MAIWPGWARACLGYGLTMCGFAGELVRSGRADRDAVEAMAATMQSRGPDGEGVWAGDRIALAHRRLKIIDLSAAGDQPMVDDALGLTVAFNGCIYNHRELRTELQAAGYEFFSTSDTEVILKGYAHWGTDCVRHFAGMFAFALCEHASERLVLARDRLGVKPLYLAEPDGRLRFASTLPALLAGGGIDTDDRPGGAAPLPQLARRRTGAAHDPRRACASSHPPP